MSAPVRLVFGVHLHQPVGNFDYIFEQHVRDVYRPFLEHAEAAGFLPITLHVSGPLLEWLEAHDAALLDTIGRLAAAGQVELLLAGFDEPILASLPRADRIEQIGRMRAFLARRFGVLANGLWLTERVWEPDLAADLHDAGVGYVLVDDRHFLATGFDRWQLHRPYHTQHDGRGVGLVVIDERMRYLVPFRPPEETAEYVRALRREGRELVVFADDGEKFGGWPGTLDWVYGKGWLDQFFATITALAGEGEVRLVTAGAAMREVAGGGVAYLPTASYREMEMWSLSTPAQRRLAALERELGDERLRGAEGLVRGGHWRNFLVKYTEANRMHKAMVALSGACRAAGDPPAARRAIGRAQCNDAYWHGVFGGLYSPHLRHAIWRELALAERELRAGQGLVLESLDFDGDGEAEFWIHSSAFSALVSPARGGAIEMLVSFAALENAVDVLTRRREGYHAEAFEEAERARRAGEPDARAWMHELPPVDHAPRALLLDRVLPGSVSRDDYTRAAYTPLASWAGARLAAVTRAAPDLIELELSCLGFEKRLRFSPDGAVRASYRWDARSYPGDAVFAPELSFAREPVLACAPEPEIWRYPIRTVGKSEHGLEETEQGVSVTPRWPIALGAASLDLVLPGRNA